MRITMTPELAHAAGKDAGNVSMRKAGRTVWNEDDADEAARVDHKLLPCPGDVNCDFCNTTPSE